MSTTFDELIKAIAKRGELSHISVIAHASRHGVTFRAMYRATTTDTHSHAEASCPVEALKQAIAAGKRNRKGKPKESNNENGDNYDFG